MAETQSGMSAQDLRRRMRAPARPAPVSASRGSMDGFVAGSPNSFFKPAVSSLALQPAQPHKRPLSPRITPTQPISDFAPRGQAAVPVQPQPSQVLKRQSFTSAATVTAVQAAPPIEDPKPKHERRHRAKAQAALITMAIFVFGIGLAASISTLLTNHSSKAQVAALAANAEQTSDGASDGTTPPSEVKPSSSAVRNYVVAPNVPRYIEIGKLKVHGRVRPMGVTKTGEIQAPANIYDAGWYNASAHPGDSGSNGAMLIDGHVLGATYPAIFSKIKTLVAGDTIKVTRGDGQVFTYEVVKVDTFDAKTLDTGMLLTSIQPGKPGLNLITCTGKYIAKQQTFDQRTVVFAVQI